MKDIPIYFTEESYNHYQNGRLAIGFTVTNRKYMMELEAEGISCDLKTDPLNCMTKVRYQNVKRMTDALFGVYVFRRKGVKV